MTTAVLPPSERPGGWGDATRFVLAAAEDGEPRTGVTATPEDARREVRRMRKAAERRGLRLKASYEPLKGGRTRWHIVVSERGSSDAPQQ